MTEERKPREIKCLVLKNGDVAVGFTEELTRTYRVEGAFLEMTIRDHDGSGQAQVRGKLQFRPFSEVSGPVSVREWPKSNVDSFQELPEGIMYQIRMLIDAEAQNRRRKQELLARRIPSRSSMSPEDNLSMLAKYVKEHGALPRGTNVSQDMNTLAGTFTVRKKSPYRDEHGD